MRNIRLTSLLAATLAISAISIAAPALAAGSPQAAPALAGGQVAAKHYQNCTALNRVYRHGVGKATAVDHVSGSSRPVTNFYVSGALYRANSGSDRDHDGIACEKL
jgi:excalibur calcium-binding domain-containing protein